MKVSVFLALHSDKNLVESAMSERLGIPKGILSGTSLPDVLSIDPDYSATPMGGYSDAFENVESLHPENSAYFAVRGTIDVDSLEDIPTEINGNPVLSDPRIDTYDTCFDDNPVGTVEDAVLKLNLTELHDSGLDGEGVAIAIVDKGINLDFLEEKLGFRPKLDRSYSWRPKDIDIEPGEYPVGHGTMCAYAALLAAPKATLIDVPALVGTPAGGAAIGRQLSGPYKGIGQLAEFWAITFTAASTVKYKALVISNSWGMYHPSWDFPPGHRGRYSDNPQHLFTRFIRSLSEIDGVDFVFASGNCGGTCPSEKCEGITENTITGANASSNVLTVAGCDVADQLVGYSSQGPSIAGMADEKPDITAYTHFLGSEALGIGVPDKGTSTACPLAAGCVAALRTQLDPFTISPEALNEQLRRSATRSEGTGWNRKIGHGIINPMAAARSLGLIADV